MGLVPDEALAIVGYSPFPRRPHPMSAPRRDAGGALNIELGDERLHAALDVVTRGTH